MIFFYKFFKCAKIDEKSICSFENNELAFLKDNVSDYVADNQNSLNIHVKKYLEDGTSNISSTDNLNYNSIYEEYQDDLNSFSSSNNSIAYFKTSYTDIDEVLNGQIHYPSNSYDFYCKTFIKNASNDLSSHNNSEVEDHLSNLATQNSEITSTTLDDEVLQKHDQNNSSLFYESYIDYDSYNETNAAKEIINKNIQLQTYEANPPQNSYNQFVDDGEHTCYNENTSGQCENSLNQSYYQNDLFESKYMDFDFITSFKENDNPRVTDINNSNNYDYPLMNSSNYDVALDDILKEYFEDLGTTEFCNKAPISDSSIKCSNNTELSQCDNNISEMECSKSVKDYANDFEIILSDSEDNNIIWEENLPVETFPKPMQSNTKSKKANSSYDTVSISSDDESIIFVPSENDEIMLPDIEEEIKSLTPETIENFSKIDVDSESNFSSLFDGDICDDATFDLTN